ncbi:MAG: hypothetical protein DDT19_01851 [Syntrophomonadaceae bacterium]|nr:hypothetical protein [Bacillota bacterium]
MSEVKNIFFKDFITLQRGFDLPKKDMVEGDYPVLGSTSIIGYHSEYKEKPPGVIIGRSGSLGTVQYINDKYWPHNTALWVKDFKGNHPRYVYYFLQTLNLGRFNSGAGVPTLNRNDLDTLEIGVHSLPPQRKIASILSAYDDLIENNNRRIKILEEMAQAIYKEWFVNFRFPGHEKVKMVKSKLGMVPEGWQVTKLNEYVDFIRGIEPGSDNYQSEYKKGMLPFLRVGDLSKRASDLFIDEDLANNKIINEDDIVVSLDGTVGIVRIGLEGCYSTGIRKLEIRNHRIRKSFLYYLMQSEHIQNILKAHAKGSTIQHASAAIDYMDFILPPESMMNKFDEITNPVIENILKLNKINNNLRAARDLLLPKLISGEIDVEGLDIRMKNETV